MAHSGSPDELDTLMGSDNQQATDPTRQGDTPAFYIALVCLSVLFLRSVTTPYWRHS